MSATFDGYPIDVVLSVKYTRKSDVTEHPVESGENVADYVRAQAAELQFEGVVSDTSTGAVAQDPSRVEGALHSLDAFRRFERIQDDGQTVEIVCSYGRFESMALTSLDAPRDHKTRRAFKFSVTFKHIRVETNDRTTIRSAVPTGNSNFGLSLDKVVNGQHVLWRKGRPPGTSPATDPPGIIIGQEVVTVAGKKFTHQSTGKPLTVPELQAFAADLNRDSSLQQRRALSRDEKKLSDIDKRLDAAQKLLDKKDAAAHPGKHPDKAMFGK